MSGTVQTPESMTDADRRAFARSRGLDCPEPQQGFLLTREQAARYADMMGTPPPEGTFEHRCYLAVAASLAAMTPT